METGGEEIVEKMEDRDRDRWVGGEGGDGGREEDRQTQTGRNIDTKTGRQRVCAVKNKIHVESKLKRKNQKSVFTTQTR